MLGMEARMDGNCKLATFALATAASFGAGCASKPAARPPQSAVISQHLLYDLDGVEADELSDSSDLQLIDSDTWQALVDSRNDDRLGSPNGTGMATVEWLEIRQRDFQRTVHGKPREYSTTYTRTTRRGFVR